MKIANARKALVAEASEARKAGAAELRARARRAVNATKVFVSEAVEPGCDVRRGALSGESWECGAYGRAAGF